jgi:glycosyltransferase involved in cell wall biosynthesis
MVLKMKILHLTTYDNFGAGKAALRLHQGLMQNKVDSTTLVANISTDTPKVLLTNKYSRGYNFIQSFIFNQLSARRGINTDNTFSSNATPCLISNDIRKIEPDLVHLHWIGMEFLRIEYLTKINVPLIWTLHDMWTFTGGCHYSGGCDLYTKVCGTCPQLSSNNERDLSHWVWQRKIRAWKNLNLTIVTPSKWLAECARKSSICKDMRIEIIPNGLDIQRYKPINRQQARNILGLSLNAKIILFGAVSATSAPRKGFQFLAQALQKLRHKSNIDEIELVIFGSSQPIDPPNLGFKINYLGRLNDDITLALVYAAADVFVAPSIEDNLPNTVMESLACGTPCVSFHIGGMSDLIEHQQNGYLAKPFDINDLAYGISWVLTDEERYQGLRDRARKKVEIEFSSELQAHRYTSLYQELKTNG